MKYPYTSGAVAVLLVIVGIILLTGITFVDAGSVGVVTRFGRVTGRVLDPGAHLVAPLVDKVLRYDTKLVIYETRKEQAQDYDKNYDEEASVYIDIPVDTNTKDGQQVNVFYTVRFAVDPTKATWIAQNIGSEDALVGKIVKTESRIWARNIPREFDASSLYSGSVIEVQNYIAERLRPVFAKNGITLDEVGIREIQFEPNYVQAIENKQIEAVKVETEKNKAAQAEFEKQRRITQAEASAQEQSLQRATLSAEVIEKIKQDNLAKAIDKWDGKTPGVLLMGEGGQFILPLSK